MTLINPKEEFIKRIKKMKFVVEDTETSPPREDKNDQYFDKYAVKLGNEYITKTTFNDLMDKVDLILANQEVILKLLAKENIMVTESPKEPVIKFSRGLYKQNVETGQKVLVGLIDNNNVVTLKEPPLSSYRNNIYYLPEWFIITEAVGIVNMMDYISFGEKKKDYPADVLSKSKYEIVIPSNSIKELSGKTGTISGVTGYVTDQGKAVYYDQYRV